jgi:hypothetical protein
MGDLEVAFRVMFRVRSESSRVNIADAIMQPYFKKMKIEEYDRFILGALYCVAVRNQYAHCHWGRSGRHLVFVNLEEFAKERSDGAGVKPRRLTLSLLQKQEAYFNYIQDGFWYLRSEYQKAVGKEPHPLVPLPTGTPQPPKYTDADKPARRRSVKSRRRAPKAKKRAV